MDQNLKDAAETVSLILSSVLTALQIQEKLKKKQQKKQQKKKPPVNRKSRKRK